MEEIINDKNIIEAVLKDLSKVFGCIFHNLLVAKHNTHGLLMDAITFVYSYFKRRKQGVKKIILRICLEYFYQEYLNDSS